MLYFPICKINIGLNIIAKRPDNYHQISSLMYPLSRLCDTLDMVASTEFSLTTSGLEVDCTMENNICYKAYKLMAEQFAISPVTMHLHKVIPSGAGLGGGSSDGSYVIRGINEIFRLGLSLDKMRTLAAQLGSDTAFFIDNSPSWAEGRGEILTPSSLSLSGYHLVILKPYDISVSTSEAYSGVHISGASGREIESLPVEKWRENVFNDFEHHIFKLYPRLSQLKDYLYNKGAIYASMSGSGSAVYGIFSQGITVDLDDVFVHQERVF